MKAVRETAALYMGCVKQKSAFEHAKWVDADHPTHAQSTIQLFAFHSNILYYLIILLVEVALIRLPGWAGWSGLTLSAYAQRYAFAWRSQYSTHTCLCVASRTFSNLPLSGNTPYLSLPTTLRPAIAKDLAESPSVRIRVHSLECFVPASLASSSFGIPLSFECLELWHFLFNCAWALNFIQLNILSIIPHLLTWKYNSFLWVSKHTCTEDFLIHFWLNKLPHTTSWCCCSILDMSGYVTLVLFRWTAKTDQTARCSNW